MTRNREEKPPRQHPELYISNNPPLYNITTITPPPPPPSRLSSARPRLQTHAPPRRPAQPTSAPFCPGTPSAARHTPSLQSRTPTETIPAHVRTDKTAGKGKPAWYSRVSPAAVVLSSVTAPMKPGRWGTTPHAHYKLLAQRRGRGRGERERREGEGREEEGAIPQSGSASRRRARTSIYSAHLGHSCSRQPPVVPDEGGEEEEEEGRLTDPPP